jgi:hypothetical protein
MIREAHLWGSEVELHYPNGLSTPEASNVDLTGCAAFRARPVLTAGLGHCIPLLAHYKGYGATDDVGVQ